MVSDSGEEFSCELDPDTKTTLKIYLYRNVKNVEYIRSNIINGNWGCAVVKPTLIVDPFQVAVCANRAAVARARSALVTRTVYTEILYNLSLSKNISQSLSKFGIEKEKDILVCFLTTPESDESAAILAQVHGERTPLHRLTEHNNINQIKQLYKLNSLQTDDNLLDIIVSKLVTKSFITH